VDGDLNRTVEQYYDSTMELYEGLWNEHIHHGFWDPDESPTGHRADRLRHRWPGDDPRP
jgi:tocopherol O-methyltransferase